MIGMLLFVNGLFVSMVAFRSTFELSNMLVANGSTITVEFFLVQWVCPSDDAIIFIIIQLKYLEVVKSIVVVICFGDVGEGGGVGIVKSTIVVFCLGTVGEGGGVGNVGIKECCC